MSYEKIKTSYFLTQSQFLISTLILSSHPVFSNLFVFGRFFFFYVFLLALYPPLVSKSYLFPFPPKSTISPLQPLLSSVCSSWFWALCVWSFLLEKDETTCSDLPGCSLPLQVRYDCVIFPPFSEFEIFMICRYSADFYRPFFKANASFCWMNWTNGDLSCFGMQAFALSFPLKWCASLSSEWSIAMRPSGLNTITPGPLPVPAPPSPSSSSVGLPFFLSQCPTCLVTPGKPAWTLSQTPWISHGWFCWNQL